jgi:hypothetical protein
MRKIHLISAMTTAFIIAVAAGCLSTGTVVITAKLSPDADGNPIHVSNQLFAQNGEMEVDLSDNATFKQYRDDIRNIDNIGFYLEVTNNEPQPVDFQLFLEPNTSANYESVQEMLDSLTNIILTGVNVPAGKTVTIDWNQSIQYVTNLDEFKDVLKGGAFSLYAAVLPRDAFDVTIDSLVVIVTLTGTK